MKDHRIELGRKGEKIAEKYLRKRGLKLAQRNLRRKAGEIDLLMWDGDELVIVEVRTVVDSNGMDISDRIPVSKRRQLVRLANHLLIDWDDPVPQIRFDAVMVVLRPKPHVEHVPNAFSPDETGQAG
jgi:putative endonuclease